MLQIVSFAFVLYAIWSLWYIRKLKLNLKSFEEDWLQISKIADHNEDGDVIIHVKHMEIQ